MVHSGSGYTPEQPRLHTAGTTVEMVSDGALLAALVLLNDAIRGASEKLLKPRVSSVNPSSSASWT